MLRLQDIGRNFSFVGILLLVLYYALNRAFIDKSDDRVTSSAFTNVTSPFTATLPGIFITFQRVINRQIP
ncbi:MAG TPA: hypothetical protein VFN95_01430, partial [Flavitalea sp.]|nr:hypothetical protein [Flavitalea sp.]